MRSSFMAAALAACLCAPGAWAADDKTAAPDRQKMIELHQKMADNHQKAVECLKSGKEPKECHEALKKDCPMAKDGKSCAMAGEGGCCGMHHGHGKGWMKGKGADKSDKDDKSERKE